MAFSWPKTGREILWAAEWTGETSKPVVAIDRMLYVVRHKNVINRDFFIRSRGQNEEQMS